VTRDKPEHYRGTWVLVGKRAYRVRQAYYGILTRGGRTSIDVLSPSGDRGIILHVRGYHLQAWVGQAYPQAGLRQVRVARQNFWALVFTFSSFAAAFAGTVVHALQTPSIGFMPVEERLELLLGYAVVIAMFMGAGATVGYLLPWAQKKAPRKCARGFLRNRR